MSEPKILLVDDEPAVLSALRRTLRRDGYQIVTAGSGAEGLAYLEGPAISVVVSDHRMPGMTGVQFLRSVREKCPDTTRMILTGYADLQSTMAAINDGEVFRFLAKPWEDEDLRRTVREGVERNALLHENRRLNALTAEQNVALRKLNATLEARVEARTADLMAAQAMLVQSEKLRVVGQLAAGVAHEINNPLNNVAGFAQLLLLRTDLNPGAREEAELILKEVERASDVIKGLLQFARPAAPARAPVDLTEIVHQALTLQRAALVKAGVEVRIDVPGEFPLVQADATQIQQVIINLTQNAAQAMEGRPAPRILIIRASVEGEWTVLQVEDTGPGIAQQHLPRLFEPFFTTKPAGQGTGLGLSVSYGIVRGHGGTLEATNSPAGGARFTMRLPVATTEARPNQP